MARRGTVIATGSFLPLCITNFSNQFVHLEIAVRIIAEGTSGIAIQAYVARLQ